MTTFRLYDVPGCPVPLAISDEHAEQIGATPHVTDDSGSSYPEIPDDSETDGT